MDLDVTVKEPDHGRSTSDTVRFRDAQMLVVFLDQQLI